MKSDPIPLPLHGSSEEVAEALQAVLSDLGFPTSWVGLEADGGEFPCVMFGPHQEVVIEPYIMPEKVRHLGDEKSSWGWYVAHHEGKEWSGRSYWKAVRQAIIWLFEELLDDSIDTIALVMDEKNADLLMEAQSMAAEERRERGYGD